MWLLQLEVLSVIAIVSALNECPDKSLPHTTAVKQFNNKCYQFVNVEEYWTDAREYCWKYGGSLVMIDSQATQDFISTSLNSLSTWNNKGVWIGLNDKGREGVYKWATKSQFISVPLDDNSWTNWASGEPGSSWKDCIRMVRGDNWKWHDTFCSTYRYIYKFICEYDMPTTTIIPTTPIREGPNIGGVIGHEMQSTTTPSINRSFKDIITVIKPPSDHLGSANNAGETFADGNTSSQEKQPNSSMIAIITGIVGSVLFLTIILLMIIIHRMKRKNRNYKHNLSRENVHYDSQNETVVAGNNGSVHTAGHSRRNRPSNAYTTNHSPQHHNTDSSYLDPKKIDDGYLEPSKLKPTELTDTYLTTGDVAIFKPDILKDLSHAPMDSPTMFPKGRHSGYLPMTGSKEKLQKQLDEGKGGDDEFDLEFEPIYAEISENTSCKELHDVGSESKA